jgi:serine/threonine protein kinase
MGACALARNNEDGRYYVIKQVDLAKLNKKERQQSLNEAKVLSSLRHPNVINYVDSFLARKSDHLCIVMEFADGGDLSNRIKNNHGVNFSESQILDWFIQITLALNYVHQRKILHRDVKTQNIFLTQDSVCKLGDFGIARTLSSTYDQANTFVGTPYYLSPELILERPYDHMSDVWALGVVLYEAMSLRHPFNANDMKSLMHRILKVQYDPPPTMYSYELRSIVSRLLVKDPLQRIRLNEVLELPVISRRMRQWLEGGVVPQKYLAALVRNKQLPPQLMLEALAKSNGDERVGNSPTNFEQKSSLPSIPPGKAMRSTPTVSEVPQMPIPARQPVRKEEDQPSRYQPQPQPPPTSIEYRAPVVSQLGGAYNYEYPRPKLGYPTAQQPSAPQLQQDYQVYRSAQAQPRYIPQPVVQPSPQPANVQPYGLPRAPPYQSPTVGGANLRQGAGISPTAGGVYDFVPPRVQPSIRPLNAFSGVAAAMGEHRALQQQQQQSIQQHNNDIQAMLQRAAQERAQRQKMR